MAPTILLVDDSSIIREAVRMTLNRTPFRLMTASTGEEALAILESNPADLALVDLRLPDADGYNLCRRIKSLDGCAALPVLLLTHINENIDRNRSREAGALGSFPKPFDTQDLLDQLQMILEDKLEAAEDEEEISELDLEEVVEADEGEEFFTTDRILAEAGLETLESDGESPMTLSKEQAAALLEPLDDDEDEVVPEAEEIDEIEEIEEHIEDHIEIEEDIQVDDVFVSHEPRAGDIHSYFADENRKLEALRNTPLSELDKQDEKSAADFAYNLVEEKSRKAAEKEPVELESWAADDLDFVEPLADDGIDIDIDGMETEEAELAEAENAPETEADWMAREMSREINDAFEEATDDIGTEDLPSGLTEEISLSVADETDFITDEVLAGVENEIEQSVLDDLIEHSPAAVAEEAKAVKSAENMVEFAPVDELSVPVQQAPQNEAAAPSDIVELFRRAIREEMAGLAQTGGAAAQHAPAMDIEKIRLAIVPELKTYLRQTVREEVAAALSERRAPRYIDEFRAALKSEIASELRLALEEKPAAAEFDPLVVANIVKEALSAVSLKAPEPDLKMLASVVRKSIQMEIGKEIGERAQSVAWEVVPELAEILIKKEVGKLHD